MPEALGLLLVAWVAWWLVNAGVLRYSAEALWLAMFVVAIPSAVVLWRQWRLMRDWLREKWRLVITAEALFLLAYLAFVMIRAANPDLWHPWRGGEKPMELAYFTAVARSSVLPPYDPWFSGGYLNYYYWGYFILSVPVRLTGIAPATAFNVAVPLLFALTATGVGSLVYNLVGVSSFGRKVKYGTSLSRGILDSRFRGNDGEVRGNDGEALGRDGEGGGNDGEVRGNDGEVQGSVGEAGGSAGWRVRKWVPGGAALAGITAAVMAAVSGNLDGVIQLAEMAQRKMQGMAAPLSSFDFWRSSRAIPETPEFEPSRLTPWLEADNFVETGFHITEFPFFTFLFADLHAHMMTMPFAILALALGFALIVGLSRVSLRAVWPWAAVFALALAVGSLWAINSWEYPAYALLMLGCVAGAAWVMPGRTKARLAVAAVLGLLALAVSYVAFLPFHAATETFGTGIEPTRWRTPISNYLLIHALPLLATAFLLSATLPRAIAPVLARVKGRGPMEARDQWMLLGVAVGLLLAGYFWAAGFVTVGFLTAALALTAWALVASLASEECPERRADLMALGMLAMALAIGIGVDLIRVEGDIARMNTLFKYYLVAWLLFAASGAYGLWRGWTAAATGSRFVRNTLRGMAAGVVLAILAGTLVYPALATPVRIADRFNSLPPTLDGTAWMPAAVYHPPDWCAERPLTPIELKWDYEAIRWLQDNVSGTPVVLEGHSVQYCWNSRISQYTGLPTVLGWPWHQQQQRGDGEIVRRRARDVATTYSTPSHDRALELLEEYGVEYIVAGALERGYYGERGIAKFDAMVEKGSLTLAYGNDGTRVYRVRRN